MIHRFEIENFLSIREPQTLDLRVAANVPEDERRFVPAWRGASERTTKVIGLFGANASGKTNVLKALAFLVWFVKDSFHHPTNIFLPFARFNTAESLGAPARLEVGFSAPLDLARTEDPESPECRYAYEVVLGGPPDRPQTVLRETLSRWPSPSGRRQWLFRRDERHGVRASGAFALAGFRQALEKILRPNASVISTLAQLEHVPSKMLHALASNAIGNILAERMTFSDDDVVDFYYKNKTYLDALNQSIESADFGIEKLDIESSEGKNSFHFRHRGFLHAMPTRFESHGTRQFLGIFPLVHKALETGSVCLIDELDASLHPMLVVEIIRWFHDSRRNPHHGQLWMTCQNATVLEELAKEEIFFCEKDQSGRTSLHGLKDIAGVRRDENFYRKYLGGSYGAVPRFG